MANQWFTEYELEIDELIKTYTELGESLWAQAGVVAPLLVRDEEEIVDVMQLVSEGTGLKGYSGSLITNTSAGIVGNESRAERNAKLKRATSVAMSFSRRNSARSRVRNTITRSRI